MMACPICGKPTETKWRPFCSKRCADVDLGKWFTGGYAIPSDDPDDAVESTPDRVSEQEDRKH